LKVAYTVSRFPKLTETFVLQEILAMEKLGWQVELYPLQREPAAVVHPEAEPIVARAHFTPWISWTILSAHFYYLCRKPAAYFATLWILMRANWGSLRFFAAAMLFFPKAVYFARCMTQQRISHLHAHFCSHPAAAAFVVHRLAGIPFSFTAHGSDLHCDRHMLREKVAAADFVVAISQYNRNLILQECGQQFADKVIVVHCGVDMQVFQPRPCRGPNEYGELFNILCTGTLHEVKGQTYLIDACRHLSARNIDFHCHFIGDGADRAMLEDQVRLSGLDDRVTFHGRQPSHAVAALLRRADAVATPSVPTASGQREGIPVVLMEAMASGVPVVASRLSGIPELIDEGVSGLLTPPGDAEALADALERLYREPQLRRLLAAGGREKIDREFNVTANAEALIRRIEKKGACA